MELMEEVREEVGEEWSGGGSEGGGRGGVEELALNYFPTRVNELLFLLDF